MIDCLLSHSDEIECVWQAGESAEPGRSGEFPTRGDTGLEIESPSLLSKITHHSGVVTCGIAHLFPSRSCREREIDNPGVARCHKSQTGLSTTWGGDLRSARKDGGRSAILWIEAWSVKDCLLSHSDETECV